MVADRDPVGISAEVIDNGLGLFEGRLAVGDPLRLIQFGDEGVQAPGDSRRDCSDFTNIGYDSQLPRERLSSMGRMSGGPRRGQSVSIRFVLPRWFRGRTESAAHSPHSRRREATARTMS